MTNIYSFIWKIGQFYKERYEDSLLFARPYNGCQIDFKEIKSVFDFSNIPEKDIFEFFSLIGVEKSYIKSTKGLIDARNQMAHATGKFQISDEDKFNNALRELVSVLRQLQTKLELTIREWYKSELLNYAQNGLAESHLTISDYIDSVFLTSHGLSKKDLIACVKFGLSRFRDRDQFDLSNVELDRIKDFHEALKTRYAEIMGIEYSEIESTIH